MPALKLRSNQEPRVLGPYERAVSALRTKDIQIIHAPRTELPLLSRERMLRDMRHGDEALAQHLLAHPRLRRRVFDTAPNPGRLKGVLFRTRIKKPVSEELGEDPFPYWYAALIPQGKHGCKLIRTDALHLEHFCVFA